jgi:diacylglycerol kinase (ATP)
VRPLHFVINPASGGGQGSRLAGALRRLAGAERVHLLASCDLPALARAVGGNGAVVACGGDGTASAVADALWTALGDHAPALGVVPLGTGNDLARSLGWPGTAPSDGELPRLLERLAQAPARALDRWVLEGPGKAQAWFNYLSFGLDARIALAFHRLRRRHPRLIRARLVNQALYGALGLCQPRLDLQRAIRLVGGPSLPPWTAALVAVNIPSYAGGVRLGPAIDAADRRLDLFPVAGGLGLGLVTARVRQPRSLGQAAELELELAHALPFQCDGEPGIADAGRYRVRWGGQVAVLVQAPSARQRPAHR